MVTTTQWILELIDKVSNPMGKITASTDKARKGVDAFHAKSQMALDAVSSQVPGASSAIGMLANPYMAAAAGAVALGATGYKAVSMASDWKTGLAKVNVTAQLTQKELQGVSDKLLDIGENNIAPIEKIPEAFNKVISAGLDLKTSMDAFQPTLRAAKAGFTDVGETAKAGVAVMNSSGENINKVYDVLFATLNKGNAEFADVAQYLPKLIPMARNAGFALGETAGAWAYLTAQGQTSERATTLAQNAMKALADPQRIKAFKEMGVNLYDSAGKIKPLTNIIDDLSVKTKGLSDLSRAKFFGKIGLDQEAASFFATATQDAKKFRETIDFTTNSQGQLNEAYKNSMTPLDHWHEITNVLKGKMIELGEKALPIINMIGEKVLGVIRYFQDLYKRSTLFRDILSAIGTTLTWTFKMAILPITALWNMIKNIGSSINWVVGLIPGFGGGFEGMYNKIRPYLIWIKEFFGQIADIWYKFQANDFSGTFNALKGFKMPDMGKIKVGIAREDLKENQSSTLESLQKKYDSLANDTSEKAKKERERTLDDMEKVKQGSSNSLRIASVTPKVKPKDLSLDLADKSNKSASGSGGSSIKNITQKIEIKNYFNVSKGTSSSEIEDVAEKVIRAINDKLRDGIVAVS